MVESSGDESPLPHPVLGEQGPLDALGVALGPRVGWPPPRAEEEERRVKERRGRRISAESRPRGTADVGWRGGLVEDLPPPPKSAGVRTEMLRGRVGRGCPLTT